MAVYIEDNLPNIQENGLNTLKAVSLGSTLAVTGATTLSSTLASGSQTITGTMSVSGLSTLTGGLVGGTQALSGAGAINLTTLITKITSTGANALTLANGTEGQVKILTMVVDGGDATLTPTTKTGYSTITFNDAGDGCILVYTTTTGWMIVANNGCTIA